MEPVRGKRWEDAADKIRETINGVGYFTFYSLREFLESGPYTARQAALSHLHCVLPPPDRDGATAVLLTRQGASSCPVVPAAT